MPSSNLAKFNWYCWVSPRYWYPYAVAPSAIPSQFQQVIVDGATAYGYQYRGETQQYQLNFSRFEEGIKHMQSILLNKTDYLRSTYIQRVSSSSSAAFF